jgi:hypothetical protein
MSEALRPYIPFLIPILLLQVGLMVFALVDLVRREQTRGPKVVWAIVIVLVNIIGPVLYLLIGRGDE